MSTFRVGVISDTHIPKKSKKLPDTLVDGLKGVDLIIHAGDINEDYVIYELEELAPVVAVAGNTDDDAMWLTVGRKKIVPVGECKIGVTHGDGANGTTLERARKAFENEGVDCIVFGHSHIPYNEWLDGVLLFNPGSPTDKRRQQCYSYGLIEVRGKTVTGEIKYFK